MFVLLVDFRCFQGQNGKLFSDWFFIFILIFIQKSQTGISLVVQWLGLCVFTAVGPHSVPGPGIRSHKPGGTAKKKKKIKSSSNCHTFLTYNTLFRVIPVIAGAHLIFCKQNRIYLTPYDQLNIHTVLPHKANQCSSGQEM